MKFAQLSQAEVNLLMKHKIGRTGWAVYCCLAAHAQNKDHAYPKIETICEWLGDQRSRKVVEKAIKQLCDTGVIFRNHRSSKKRFVLAARKRVPKLTTENSNPSNLEVDEKNNPSNLGGFNPSNLEGFNPSNIAVIKEKGKDKENISKFNEDTKLKELDKRIKELTDETTEVFLEEFEKDWDLRVLMCIGGRKDHEVFSMISGIVLSNNQIDEVERIYYSSKDTNIKKELIEKILKTNPFKG